MISIPGEASINSRSLYQLYITKSYGKSFKQLKSSYITEYNLITNNPAALILYSYSMAHYQGALSRHISLSSRECYARMVARVEAGSSWVWLWHLIRFIYTSYFNIIAAINASYEFLQPFLCVCVYCGKWNCNRNSMRKGAPNGLKINWNCIINIAVKAEKE